MSAASENANGTPSCVSPLIPSAPISFIRLAIAFGHGECKRLARAQRDLAQRAAKPRWAFDAAAGRDAALLAQVKSLAAPKLAVALATHEKQSRAEAVHRVAAEVEQSLGIDETRKAAFREAF